MEGAKRCTRATCAVGIIDDIRGKFLSVPCGIRATCAYLILRDKVIKPLLAGVVRLFGRAPKVQAPVDQRYVHLREALNRIFETIGLAPA
jgi:hypothetical protein